MVETAPTPVVVKENAGFIDSAQAALRYITFLITAFTAIIGFLRTRDIAGLLAFVQSSGGEIFAAVSGLIALAIAAYGVFKTHKRGTQLVTAADAAPDRVAKVVE